ncbi:MAG TPA: aminodeoxychorismate lyase [Moraxellaceae bacterium]
MSGPVWVNGSEGGHLDPADRGLAYGDGLFETLRVEKGRAVLGDLHFSRLRDSAAALGLALDVAALQQDFLRFLQACPARCVAKIIVTRGVSGRGYLPDPAAVPTVIFSAHPLTEIPEAQDGIEAAVCTLQLGLQPLLAGHKHLNRLEQVLLRRELEALGKREALVCASDGQVVEGVFSNVFLVRDGVLYTPLIDQAGVRGVMRAAILAHAAAQGIPTQESRLTVDAFRDADEVFFCNSVNGIWPVSGLSGRHWTQWPLTRRLQAFWQEQL